MFKPGAAMGSMLLQQPLRNSGRTGTMLQSIASAERVVSEKVAVVTGFEGCTPHFSDPNISPAYQPTSCQPYHSGKVSRGSAPLQLPYLLGNFCLSHIEVSGARVAWRMALPAGCARIPTKSQPAIACT